MSKISKITYQLGCAVSEDIFYAGATLDDYSENGFTRMFIVQHSNGAPEWSCHDLRFPVNCVCLLDKVNENDDRLVFSLGEDGEIEKFDGIDSEEEYIPNSGLNAHWSNILGYMNSIRAIDSYLVAGGSSGQVYTKSKNGNWNSINITFENNIEFLDKIEKHDIFPDIFDISLFDVNGVSINQLYAVGRLGNEGLIAFYNGECWKFISKLTPADLHSILLIDQNNILICGAHGNLLLGNIETGFKRVTSMGVEDDFYNAAIFNNEIYIASNRYLYKYSGGLFTKVNIREDLNSKGFIKVESIGNVLWVLTEKLIIKFNGNSWVFFENPDNNSLLNDVILNVKAKKKCPKSGFWFTVAKENSRQHFKQGDIFPNFESDWGDVYWQFDGEE